MIFDLVQKREFPSPKADAISSLGESGPGKGPGFLKPGRKFLGLVARPVAEPWAKSWIDFEFFFLFKYELRITAALF